MAARKQLFHPKDVQEKIQTSQLINRLQNHALFSGEADSPEGRRTLMTDSQVRAAFGLINKTVPDQKFIEHSGNVTLAVNGRTADL